MADETRDIVKLAVDTYNGKVAKYSLDEANDVLNKALVAANNGKTYLDIRDMRDGKCSGLFSLIENIIQDTVASGLDSSDAFNSFVDYRNTARGDKNMFRVQGNDYFTVSRSAVGTHGIRRHRLIDSKPIAVDTYMHIIRAYDEIDRFLSNSVDINYMIDTVNKSFTQAILEECLNIWASVASADIGSNYYAAAGTLDEKTMLNLIAHVQAAAGGQQATIVGTQAALFNMKESIVSDVGKNELHEFGVYGHYYGTPVVEIPQKYKAGTQEFAFDDKTITIVAGSDKPIKFVYEGNALVIPGDPMKNADFTQEYTYGLMYGAALVAAGNSGIGKYVITG